MKKNKVLPDWLYDLTIRELKQICQKYLDDGGSCGVNCKLGKYGFWDDLEDYDPVEEGWFGCQCMFAYFYAGIHQECL